MGSLAPVDTAIHSSYIYGSVSTTEEREQRLKVSDYQGVYYKTVSLTQGCINKTGTIALSMDKLTWNG